MNSPAARTYRPDLDGLRAIAILSVIFGHAGVPHLTGGFTGVDIFFVLSGYLIGGHIFAELGAGTFRFADFYARRVKRILPALLAVIAFALVAGWLLLSPAELAALSRSAFAAAFSSSNILYWGTANYFASKSSLDPMLMTWSLGVEEQFYAVIPLLMVLLFRIRRNWILPAAIAVSILSFLFAWTALANHPMLVFYLLPSRAWELGAGVALAIREMKRGRQSTSRKLSAWIGIAGLALILAPLFVITSQIPFPGPAALPSVAGTVLLIATGSSWLNRRALSFAPLVFIGKISYSLYLWHWPLLAFARILCGEQLPAIIAAAALAAALVAAVLSYYLIEQPFRRSRSASHLLLIRYAAACAALIALCAALWLSRGATSRFPQLAKIEAASLPLHSDPCLAGYGRDTPNLSATCNHPLSSKIGSEPVAVALWGDSHAAALAPALRSIAAAQGYGFVQFGKASCPPFAGATHFSPRIPLLAGECTSFNQRVVQLLQSDAHIRIVILNADWAGYLYRDWQDGWLAADAVHASAIPTDETSRRLFAGSLTATIASLESMGKGVVVLDDVPSFAIDPMSRVRAQQIPLRRWAIAQLGIHDLDDSGSAEPARDPHAALASALLAQSVRGLARVELIDLKPNICDPAGQCLYRDGSTLFYGDSNHLTAAGARCATRNLRLPEIGRSSP